MKNFLFTSSYGSTRSYTVERDSADELIIKFGTAEIPSPSQALYSAALAALEDDEVTLIE